jgi:hypothetical protein
VALCGGEIETGSLVSEQWLLEVERAFHRTAEDAGNAAAHRAHDGNRQAPAELRGEQIMSKQIQDAYIVAATRTAGRQAQGHVGPRSPGRHAGARLAVGRWPSAGLRPELVGDVVVGCAMPEAEQGMNVARIGLLLAGLPNTVPGITVNRFCASPVCRPWRCSDRIMTRGVPT